MAPNLYNLEAWRRSPKGKPIYELYKTSCFYVLEDARKNPTPDRVVYRAKLGAPFYNPRRDFLWLPSHIASPSDCEWIVPGTLWDTSDL